MKKIVFLMTLSVLLVSANFAGAVYVDFDNLPLGNIDGVNLGGVTITSTDGSTYTVSDAGVGYRSPFNAVTNNGFVTYNDLILTFDVPRGFVAFTIGDKGGDTDGAWITVYDNADNVIDDFFTGEFGGNPIDANIMVDYFRVILEWNYMKKVVIHDAINAGVGLDDLEFCQPVPVPPTLLLLGAGLIGLIPFRKRFGK